MRMLPFLLIDTAVLFVVFTLYTLFEVGPVEAFATVGHNLATWQMTGDIVLGLGSACALMVLDSRRAGIRVGPYLLATLTLGAPGPLFYLARRAWLINKA